MMLKLEVLFRYCGRRAEQTKNNATASLSDGKAEQRLRSGQYNHIVNDLKALKLPEDVISDLDWHYSPYDTSIVICTWKTSINSVRLVFPVSYLEMYVTLLTPIRLQKCHQVVQEMVVYVQSWTCKSLCMSRSM